MQPFYPFRLTNADASGKLPSMDELNPKFIDKIQDIPRDEWNELADADYPFLRHEFLSAFEESGSVSKESGWIPHHFTLRDADDKLLAVMPAYIKSHSYGEYVFDWSWANSYYQNGMDYYPKLLTAIPFTPCAGPRLLIAPNVDRVTIIVRAVQLLQGQCEKMGLSSWHLLFPEENLVELIEDSGTQSGPHPLLKRIDTQFHWYNRDYETFNDYLGAMTSRKRKSIRREREKVAAQEITFLHLTGEQITPEYLRDFYIFYHATYLKRGRQGYLNQTFFELLVETMPKNVLIVMAQYDKKNIAASLFFIGGDTIYGRYWGCLEEYDQLHFETCYYQGIDYCIQNKLAHFDAGAQGEHKIARGFEPIQTCSYHWIKHTGFHDAIERYLDFEHEDVQSYMKDAASYLPFKK